MIKFSYVVILVLFISSHFGLAQNPILKKDDPNFIYIADPAAEVFNGKVYVYGSHDQPDAVDYETMKDYVLLESSDLKTWINHGVILDPQLDKGFEYAQSNMNAPDAAFKDGWYYFYFPSDITHVGVAKSRTPVGPWETAVTNEIATIFDPTVFVDDDGQAYIYGNDHWVDFGEQGSHIVGAKLKDNMIEIDGPWIRISKETVNEAVHVFKREGIYYFSARVGAVTKYWMADSPLPTYAELKGELAPNSPESPNHTSVIEFKDQWYLFYHRGDVNDGSRYRRSAAFDKLTFREDGTIEPVVYTLDKGVEITVPNYKKRVRKKRAAPSFDTVRKQAEDFSVHSGVTRFDKGSDIHVVGEISGGDWIGYEGIDFGRSAEPFEFKVRVAAANAGASIVLRINSPTGNILRTIPVPATGGMQSFKTLTTSLNRIRGAQTIYFTFIGGAGSLLNIDWFEWTPAAMGTKKH